MSLTGAFVLAWWVSYKASVLKALHEASKYHCCLLLVGRLITGRLLILGNVATLREHHVHAASARPQLPFRFFRVRRLR